MTAKELRGIRKRIGLTQAQFAERIRVSRVSVARMETGLMIVTPPMELLIQYMAREAGVEIPSYGRAGGGAHADKEKHRPEPGAPGRKNRRGQGAPQVQRGRR